jgi:hypothetical protein
MKTVAVSILMVLLSAIGFSQDPEGLVSKKGTPILPEQGDISFGIDVVPFFNIFKTGTGSPGFNPIVYQTILGKYFITDKQALTVRFGINFLNDKSGDNDFTNYQVDNNTDLTIGIGYEWRRGKGRVQGYFGGEGYFFYNKNQTKDEDGNLYVDNQFMGGGIDGVLGAEYFIAAKLSLGGQFRWGPSFGTYKDNQDNEKEQGISVNFDNLGGAIIMAFHF